MRHFDHGRILLCTCGTNCQCNRQRNSGRGRVSTRGYMYTCICFAPITRGCLCPRLYRSFFHSLVLRPAIGIVLCCVHGWNHVGPRYFPSVRRRQRSFIIMFPPEVAFILPPVFVIVLCARGQNCVASTVALVQYIIDPSIRE